MTTTPSTHRRAALGARGGRVVVDGIALAVDDIGRGPAVVCLHAIGHGAAEFAPLAARLASHHRVVALDWPGQGCSADDREPPTAARYAELLAGVLDALGLERAVLVGNSIGGAAAIRFAATHPERVQGLVLENPGGLAPVDDVAARLTLAAMARFFGAGARGARWYPRAFAAYYRTCVLPGRVPAAVRARIVDAAFEIAPLLADAWRGFAQPSTDLRPLLPCITCPVLFAWGERDRFVALSRSLPAIGRIAHARLHRFPVTHAAHLEAPEAFADALEAFLADVDVRPAAAPAA